MTVPFFLFFFFNVLLLYRLMAQNATWHNKALQLQRISNASTFDTIPNITQWVIRKRRALWRCPFAVQQESVPPPLLLTYAMSVDNGTYRRRTTNIPTKRRWMMTSCATSAFSLWSGPWTPRVDTPTAKSVWQTSYWRATSARWIAVRWCCRPAASPACWCTSFWINWWCPAPLQNTALKCCRGEKWRDTSGAGEEITLRAVFDVTVVVLTRFEFLNKI